MLESVTLEHASTDDLGGEFVSALADVSRYPQFEFSNRDVKRAGELIASNLPWTDESAPAIREAFRIANSWRDAHAYPMRSIRYSVLWHMRESRAEGITAARLKRMQAIRRKLRRIKLNLNQLQDLGGCRAILSDIDSVHALVASLKQKTRHELQKEDDYIESPKADGYRSHHLIFRFNPPASDLVIFGGKRIELQVRTRLQHAWATAVEAVGLFRGEHLKNNQGSRDWLRLFSLMSAEFAEAERCPVPPGTPEGPERRAEIRRLANSLGAISVLDGVRYGVRGTDAPLAPGYRPTYYLIRFDHTSKAVHVEPYNKPRSATDSYDSAEEQDNKTGLDTQNVVLVEVDKIENLKAAYPNYFGDVELFKTQLRAVVLGGAAVEYALAPQQKLIARAGEQQGSPGWLRRNPFPRPDSGLSKKKKR